MHAVPDERFVRELERHAQMRCRRKQGVPQEGRDNAQAPLAPRVCRLAAAAFGGRAAGAGGRSSESSLGRMAWDAGGRVAERYSRAGEVALFSRNFGGLGGVVSPLGEGGWAEEKMLSTSTKPLRGP